MTTRNRGVTFEAPPPADLALERAVLGAVFANADVARLVAALDDELFFTDAHRSILHALRVVAPSLNGAPPDAVLVHAVTIDLNEPVDHATLAGLMEEGTVQGFVPQHVEQLRRRAAARQRCAAARCIQHAPTQDDESAWRTARGHLARADELEAPAVLGDPGEWLGLMTYEQMRSAPARQVEYHLQGWTVRGGINALVGSGESGKSMFALHLGLMSAAQRQAFSASSDASGVSLSPGPVITVSAENAIEEDERRVQLQALGHGLPETLPYPFTVWPAHDVCLTRDDDYRRLVALVDRVKTTTGVPPVVILDSGLVLSGLEDENNNAAIRKFMTTRVQPLARRYLCTVYVLMHSPKPSQLPGARLTDEGVARGGGGWRDAVDAQLYLRRDASLGPDAFVIRHSKARTGRRHQPIWFRIEDVEKDIAMRLTLGGTFSDETGQGTSPELARSLCVAVDVLKAHPSGMYQAELQEKALAGGVTEATFRRSLNIIKGKEPWPAGPLAGRKVSIVTVDEHGRKVFLTYLPLAMPTSARGFSDSESE